MLNSVCLVGRLVADPEQRFFDSGESTTKFRVAVDRDRKNKQGERETDFISVVTFGKTAEFAAQYLAKGRLVSVDGRLQVRQYQTQNGQNREAIEVVAESVNGLDRAPDAAPSAPAPAETPAATPPAASGNGTQTFQVTKIAKRQSKAGKDFYLTFGPGHEAGELMFADALKGTGIELPEGEIEVQGFIAVLEPWKDKVRVKELVNADAPADTSAEAFDDMDDPFGD